MSDQDNKEDENRRPTLPTIVTTFQQNENTVNQNNQQDQQESNSANPIGAESQGQITPTDRTPSPGPPSILFTPSETQASSSMPPSPETTSQPPLPPNQPVTPSPDTTPRRQYTHSRNQLSVESAHAIIAGGPNSNINTNTLHHQPSRSDTSDASSTRVPSTMTVGGDSPDKASKNIDLPSSANASATNLKAKFSDDSNAEQQQQHELTEVVLDNNNNSAAGNNNNTNSKTLQSREPPSKFHKAMSKVPLVRRWFPADDKSANEGGEQDENDATEAAELIKIPDPEPQEMGSFTILPSQLTEMLEERDVDTLDEKFGGHTGLAKALQTDIENGLDDSDDTKQRQSAYGPNTLPKRKSKSLLYLMWLAFQDQVLILLSVAAVVSLALGLYNDLGAPPREVECPDGNGICYAPSVEWVEGVAIIVAIVIVVLVGSLNDWRKEQQFKKLNAQKEDRTVQVIRNGSQRLLSVHDILVGDVLVLEPGEIIPVDGVLLQGYNVVCDESSATGESDAIRKTQAPEAVEQRTSSSGKPLDPFILSGSKVTEGTGHYLAISVGRRSFYGKVLLSLQGGEENTPLQLKLNRLAELIAKLGGSAGLLLFSALMIRFFVQLSQNPDRTPNEKAQNFIHILIIAVTVIVVAVPEGLPLAVTLALSFATRRMTRMNLLVRVLSSCETMANATVICTDKTGTLTQNVMTVVAGSIGVRCKFAEHLGENAQRTNVDEENQVEHEERARSPSPSPKPPRKDFSIDMNDVNSHISSNLANLMNTSIAINSTAFEGKDENGNLAFVGSKTETALMTFAKNRGWDDYRKVRDSTNIVQVYPFNSTMKSMGVVAKLPDGRYRFFIKGASEILSRASNRHVVVQNPTEAGDDDPASTSTTNNYDVPTKPFDEETTANINRTIIFYADQTLRTIALCYRDFPSWPPPPDVAPTLDDDGLVKYEDLAKDLTLLAITAIEDPLRERVTDSVRTCQNAGVAVKMVTGDNVLTARSIATQCGIYTQGGIIMEGPTFRNLPKKDMEAIVPRLQVLARSSPIDKKLLVETLKGMGEVVGVTGDGMNDGPALKTANVGFSMGIAGTEIAKEASDIILMDDNFASIVSAIMWGRCVNDSVRKFLQFQISVNITAVIVTFVTAISSVHEESVLTAVQLLWVNLIMDTFAALALATDPATPESLKRKPDKKLAPLISIDMWKMIIGQSIFQLVVTFVLHFAGKQILDTGATPRERSQLKTLVFNTFVWCQIFNMFNARRLDRGLNIFSNWKNWQFWMIFVIMCGGQALIVNVGGAAFSVSRIPGNYWAISIIVGLFSLPVAVLVRLLPTMPFQRWAIRFKLFPDPDELPTQSPEAEEREWNEGITKVIDNLSTFSKIKGGRMRSSSLVVKSRSAQLKENDIHPSSLLAMVPALVASSVGAGWRPESNGGSLSDPASFEPSKSTTALWAGQVQVHPDTDADDEFVRKYQIPPSPVSRSRSPSIASSALAVPRAGTSPGGSPIMGHSPPPMHRRTPSATSGKPPSSIERIVEDDEDDDKNNKKDESKSELTVPSSSHHQ